MRACYKRFGPGLRDRMTARLSLKVRLLKAEMIETLLEIRSASSYGYPKYHVRSSHRRSVSFFFLARDHLSAGLSPRQVSTFYILEHCRHSSNTRNVECKQSYGYPKDHVRSSHRRSV